MKFKALPIKLSDFNSKVSSKFWVSCTLKTRFWAQTKFVYGDLETNVDDTLVYHALVCGHAVPAVINKWYKHEKWRGLLC